MKSHWEQIKLADLFELQMGKTPAREKDQYWKNGDNKWVSIADIGKFLRYTDETKEKITDIAISESGIKQVPKNTLIMSFKLSLGKVAITSETIYTNEAIMAFIDRKKRPLSLSFLFHLFKNKDWSAGTNKAVLGMTLNKATLKEISIPVPPLLEQEEIAQKLDAVCRLITLRKQQLQKLDQLASSRFIEMFGNPFENPREWSIISIGTIIQHANNGMTRRGNDEAGNIVLRLVELQAGFLDYTNPNRIILTKQESERFLLKENDFLFARVNGNPENVGRCTYFKELSEPVYHNDHIIRVQFKEQTISSEYLQHLLNSPYGRSEMRNKIKTSAGQYTINQEGIGGIRIPLPPLELQNEFAAFVEQLDKSKLADQTYGVAA